MLQSCAVRPSAGIQKPGPQEQKICQMGQDLCFGGVVHLGKTCEPGRWAPRGSCEPGRWAPRTNKSQIPVNVKTTVIGLSVYQLVTLMDAPNHFNRKVATIADKPPTKRTTSKSLENTLFARWVEVAEEEPAVM